MTTKTTLIFLLLTAFQRALWAQDLEAARRLAVSGNHYEAEKIYNEVLAKDPDNMEALIGSGYNYSWAKLNDQAESKFEAALAIDPNNKRALVGKGYNLAWKGQFAAAKYPFIALERLEPGSQEARKGLGYVYLWQGNGRVAIDYFEKLILEFPDQTEYYIALAHSYLIEHEVKKARVALNSCLQLDSSNRIARQLLQNTYSVAAPIELDVWAGYSRLGDMGVFNLRTVQLTGQVAKKLRMYLKYDNSLTLDLAALVRNNQEAQAFSLGGVIAANPQLTSRFEYGTRILPDNATQQVFGTEQVYFPGNNWALKAGGFFAKSNKLSNEWLAYLNVRIPVSKVYAIEPFYFFSRVDGAPKPENRFMLNNQFRNPGGYEINLGLLYGLAGVGSEVSNNSIYGGYLSGLFPFTETVWGQLSLRYEKAPFDKLVVLAGGVKLRLQK